MKSWIIGIATTVLLLQTNRVSYGRSPVLWGLLWGQNAANAHLTRNVKILSSQKLTTPYPQILMGGATTLKVGQIFNPHFLWGTKYC